MSAFVNGDEPWSAPGLVAFPSPRGCLPSSDRRWLSWPLASL